MANDVLLYISAGPDLRIEREVLGRAVTEIPVDLGWRIVHSPGPGRPVERRAVQRADVHLLLMGADIRAPIGAEWLLARQAGRRPFLLLKQDVPRTPSALRFIRYLEKRSPEGASPWQPFKDRPQLRRLSLQFLADYILARATRYALSTAERERLTAWRSELGTAAEAVDEATRGGAGQSSVLLSLERYEPTRGVLLQPKDRTDPSQKAGDR